MEPERRARPAAEVRQRELPAGNYTGVTDFWFTPTVDGQPWATKPANGTLPNQNRNSIGFNNVGFQNWNLALFKAFRITERPGVPVPRRGLQLAQPSELGRRGHQPDVAPRSAWSPSKSSERNMQVALRLTF